MASQLVTTHPPLALAIETDLALQQSPLLRATFLTLHQIVAYGLIALTTGKAAKRYHVVKLGDSGLERRKVVVSLDVNQVLLAKRRLARSTTGRSII